MDSNIEIEAVREGVATVKLSKVTNKHIRVLWANALIVKVYGRSVGLSYL